MTAWRKRKREKEGGRKEEMIVYSVPTFEQQNFLKYFPKQTCGKMSNLEIELDNLTYEIIRCKLVKWRIKKLIQVRGLEVETESRLKEVARRLIYSGILCL